MIRLREDNWIRDADLEIAVHGREDDPELTARCVRELSSRSPTGSRSRAAEVSVRTANLQRAAQSSSSRAAEQLRERVKDLEATVDTLLRFVPTRAAPLAGDRQADLALLLSRWVADFGLRVSVVSWTDEEDPMSSAAQRLTIVVDAKEATPAEFAEMAFHLHEQLANELEAGQREAVRMVVEPDRRATTR